jgi:hypothetical protein
MKIRLSLILMALPVVLLSQNNIRGKVLDNGGRPIAFATVQIQKNGSTLRYTATDQKGEFAIALANQPLENLMLKTSHINYETDTLAITKDHDGHPLSIVLFEKKEALREVVVQSKLGAMKINGDTLSYNLKAFTTGTEEKLKDVLRKLPGIEITEDGKIMAQGKPINHLLINGKKMFGDNHQIATENINAAMLDGIDLLNNYETFEASKEIEGSNQTALNVKIKKGFLGRITGNTELLGAYDKRYKAHANLFRFDTRLNLSSVADWNNTGYQPLSSKDYFSMNRSIRQDLRNNNASLNSMPHLDDMPSFLLSDDNIATKNSGFVSFDLAYQPSKHVQINGFSISNRLKTTENLFSSRLLLDINQNVSITENTHRDNGFFYNQSKFNIDYKPSANTLWNYTVLLDVNAGYSDHDISNNLNDSTNRTVSNQDRLNFSLGQQLSLIRRVAKKKLLSFNIFHETKRQNSDLNLQSNIRLFNIDNQYAQANRIKKDDVGLYAKYTQKIGHYIARVSTGFVHERGTFGTANPTAPDASATLAVRYGFLDISLQKKTGKWHYQARAEIRPYFIQGEFGNNNRWVLLPSAQLKYNFSQTHHVLASYSRSVDFPKIDRLNDFNYAEDFRTYTVFSAIATNTLLQQDAFSLNYLRLDLYSGTVFLISSSYTQYGNRLSTNTSRKNSYNQIEPIVAKNQFAWNNTLSYEQRISRLKNKFKIGGNFVKSNFINQINGLNNRQHAVFYNIRTALLSNFKATYFNYEIAFSYAFQETKSSLFNQTNSVKRLTPAVNFEGTIDEKWLYRISNAYEKFRSQSVATQFYNLGVKIRYRPKKWSYWLEGNNLLNLNNPQVIKAAASNNILSTEIVSRLAGYIGFGLGFDF